MSGIIGHVMYAILGAKAAAERRLPVARVIARHQASYLAGSYLGCDIQTMPEAVCVDTGREVGYALVPLEKSPLTGGEVRPYTLSYDGRSYRPREIHELFYGRSHLAFGWNGREKDLTLPWQHLPDYCAAAAEDAVALFGPGERPLAYLLGWMAHLVGDGLIKSIGPGVTLDLLGGKYTPKNRPVQDLVTYHEVGVKELGLNWAALLADLAETPAEPAQLHYMRVGQARGSLGRDFPDGWAPEHEGLLRAVLEENRRYLRVYQKEILRQMALRRTEKGWECDPALSETAGGLSYAEMVAAADKAHFRRALVQIAEAVADLFEQVAFLTPLRDFPKDEGPGWAELKRRWNEA